MSFSGDIATLCDKLRLPEEITRSFMSFTRDYEKAVAPSSVALFSQFLKAVKEQLDTPHQFSSFHKAIPSYYQLGLDFVRPLVDFAHSELLGKEALHQIDAYVKKKENVILFANHQTEIDPQLISLLIEKEAPKLAFEMIFVAGHRVTQDPLAVPLTLGRNLICIYSKRHIAHPPEKKEEKMRHNTQSLKVLQNLLSEGGKCIYVAPSGGRDRLGAHNKLEVAPFDPDSVELFYLLAQKGDTPCHFFPLSLKTYDLLPPPDAILEEIGEARHTRFSPVHLFFGKEIDMEHVASCHTIQDKHERRQARTDAIWRSVVDNYERFS